MHKRTRYANGRIIKRKKNILPGIAATGTVIPLRGANFVTVYEKSCTESLKDYIIGNENNRIATVLDINRNIT